MTLTRTQFTTAEVCEMTGATPRQLQRWDQDGIVKPIHEGHRRLYSESQAAMVRKIVQLRFAGVGVKRAVRILSEGDFSGVALVITNDQCVRVDL